LAVTHYIISSASRKPSLEVVTRSTGFSPAGWRAWWQAEAANQHTDWISLIDAAGAVLARLRLQHVACSS
jgi:hypothetical protein